MRARKELGRWTIGMVSSCGDHDPRFVAFAVLFASFWSLFAQSLFLSLSSVSVPVILVLIFVSSRVVSLEDPAKRKKKSGYDSPDKLLLKEGRKGKEEIGKNRNRVQKSWAPFLGILTVAFFLLFVCA